uniref:ribosomal protein S4 n=1 Tax=Cephaleuros lagerheimii TaxID=2738443 RepID=UPI0030016800
MRYTGPKLKILRRLNLQKLPGLTQKSLKNFKESSKKQSLYSIRLMEKQKLRFNYGLTHHQFLNYVKRAQKTSGSTGENLIKFLESRFDNILFRLKLAPTINAARQLITHGHFEINKKKVTIPSYECSINELNLLEKDNENSFNTQEKKLPNYLLWDENRFVGTISQEISLKDPVIQQYFKQLNIRILYVIEFFARQL